MSTEPSQYHVWVMNREHGVHVFGVDPVLRRLPECYDRRKQAYRVLGQLEQEGKVMGCTEVHSFDQLLARNSKTAPETGRADTNADSEDENR